MQLAEERLRNHPTETYNRAMELKLRFKPLYNLSEQDFEGITRRALALNVRDGYCHNKRMPVYDDKN